MYLGVEGEDLRSGEKEVFVTREEFLKRAIPIGTDLRGVLEFHGRDVETAFNFPLDFGLELGSLLRIVVERGQATGAQGVTKGQPGVPELLHGKIRAGGLDYAAEGFESRERFLAELQNSGLHFEIAVEIAQPGYSRAVKISLERLREGGRIMLDGKRGAWVRPGHHA